MPIRAPHLLLTTAAVTLAFAVPSDALAESLPSAPTSDLASAITFWPLHISDMWGARVAILTGNDAQTAMAELSEHSARGRELPFELRVFPPSEEAAATTWLLSGG